MRLGHSGRANGDCGGHSCDIGGGGTAGGMSEGAGIGSSTYSAGFSLGHELGQSFGFAHGEGPAWQDNYRQIFHAPLYFFPRNSQIKCWDGEEA